MKYSSPLKHLVKHEDELLNALKKVIHSDQLILGKEVASFEHAFAKFTKCNYALGVNSCTDALTISLIAAGIKKDDKVITTALTAPATVVAILNVGAIPIIVDVEDTTYCISPEAISRAIDDKTRAVLPVHLHGFSANMDAITAICKQHQLILIEDCAQACGTEYKGQKVGNFGIAGAYSFYPTKNIGCLGDGGAISTNDVSFLKKIKAMRNYGFNESGKIVAAGFNSRMDEIQAAFLNVIIKTLEERNNRRFSSAKKYHEALDLYSEFLPPLIPGSTYHQFCLRVPNRNKFIEQLDASGLTVGIHYPYTMKDHPAFEKYCQDIPKAETAAKELVSIPIQPEVLDNHFDQIVEIVAKCLKKQ